MSFGIQTQSTLTLAEITLFRAEGEEGSQIESVDSTLPEGQENMRGGLNAGTKHYTLSARPHVPHAKVAREYILNQASKTAAKTPFTETPSFMGLASKTPFPPVKADLKPQTPSSHPQKTSEGKPEAKETLAKNNFERILQKEPALAHTLSSKGRSDPFREAAKMSAYQERSEKGREKSHEGYSSLASRQWSREETKEWWEARYHQRERDGNQKGGDQEQNREGEENRLRIGKSVKASSKKNAFSEQSSENGTSKLKKPELPPPKLGVFALYYILTKLGILSDGTSNFAYKNEIEVLDFETAETHKKRLEEVREAIKKEKENVRWSVALKVFSWLGAMTGIVAGIALIATGVGVVAGAMIIAGGVIQISSQIMEVSGGWKKVAEILPGEDSEKKRAVLNWMQIGIAALCLALSATGVIWGGFANFGEAMQKASNAIGGIASMGFGVTTIGESLSEFMFKNKLADIKKFDIRLVQLRAMRQDLMEKVDWGMDRLEQLFEDLARALEFETELFQADQTFYRG